MLNLVYDRTAEDVANGSAKGYYRYTDLNRVQSAVSYLRGLFTEAGYNEIPSYTLPTWAENNVPKRNQMDNYLAAVQSLHGLFIMLGEPTLPYSMDRLNYRGANAIEQFLTMMEEAYNNISGAWFYCDEVYSGEVDV